MKIYQLEQEQITNISKGKQTSFRLPIYNSDIYYDVGTTTDQIKTSQKTNVGDISHFLPIHDMEKVMVSPATKTVTGILNGKKIVLLSPFGSVGDTLHFQAIGEDNTSFITVIISEAYVQRLQDLTGLDAIKEGVHELPASGRYVMNDGDQHVGMAYSTPLETYIRNAGELWHKNPWVWVIEFKLVQDEPDILATTPVSPEPVVKMPVAELKHLMNNNPFTRKHYQVDFSLINFIRSMLSYTLGVEHDNNEPLARIFEACPPFQRDNNKWSEAMQVSFIENLILGYKTHIMLYEVGDNAMIDCKILDGLQRLTALYRFSIGEIRVFGYTMAEMKAEKILFAITRTIGLRVYSFNNEKEVVEFYIKMNENITHSKEDIDRAKRYLATLNV